MGGKGRRRRFAASDGFEVVGRFAGKERGGGIALRVGGRIE
jgi:hypothetical protein